jgi:drug/metabolite transporter (DMT)-like permease
VSIPNANGRGIAAIVFGMGSFSFSDALTKWAADFLPVGEVIFTRAIAGIAFFAIAIVLAGQVRSIPRAFSPMSLLRGTFDAIAVLLFITALVHMNLADLSAVVLVQPLLITALAVVLFGEQVGWRRWLAIMIGLVGTLFIVKPTPSAFDAWALLGLGAALGGAARDLVTRRISPAVPSLCVCLVSSIAVAVASLLIAYGESWSVPGLLALMLCAAAGIFFGIGTFLIVLAFRSSDLGAVVPFRYALLVWAGLWGYLFFGELPDRWTFVGAALIVASGLYTLHREAMRRRYISAQAQTAL